MPLNRRLAPVAMAADADAHSRMSLGWLSRQKDKDKVLKLASDPADTEPHARWPKTGLEKAKGASLLGLFACDR